MTTVFGQHSRRYHIKHRPLLPFVLAMCFCVSATDQAPAITLLPGDLLIVDQSAFGNTGGVIRVDPVTGDQSHVSSLGSFLNPIGIAIDATGDLLIVDTSAFDNTGGVIRVDPVTGAQSHVSSLGSFLNPVGIAIVSSPIPEPTSLIVWLFLGCIGLTVGRRRSNKAA